MSDSQTTNTKILIVDDDELLLRSYRLLLKRSFQVITVTTAAEARTAAAQERLDLAIVDIFLGPESGLDVVRKLKAAYPTVRVAATSAMVTTDLTVLAVRAGADAVVAKPASVAQILLRLNEELPPELDRLKPPTLARMEYEHIRRALSDYGGNVARTARDLGIDRATLHRKLTKNPPK